MERIEKLESIANFLVRSNPSQEVLKNFLELMSKPDDLDELSDLILNRLATKAMLSEATEHAMNRGQGIQGMSIEFH